MKNKKFESKVTTHGDEVKKGENKKKDDRPDAIYTIVTPPVIDEQPYAFREFLHIGANIRKKNSSSFEYRGNHSTENLYYNIAPPKFENFHK